MVRDDIKKQRELMKNKSLLKKVNYFIFYNKFKVLIAFLITFLLIYELTGIIHNEMEKSISVIMVNSNYYNENDISLLKDYARSRSINTKKYPTDLDLSIHIVPNISNASRQITRQKLLDSLQKDHIDIMIGNEWLLDGYASKKLFSDIRKLLPDDLYDKFKNNIIYCKYENGDKIPVAINITDCSKLKDTKIYPKKEQLFLAVPVNSQHTDVAIDFIRFLYDY